MANYCTGDFVKVEFKDEKSGEAEWMWVKVDYCDDEQRVLFGWLDNQPVVFANKLRLGQHLAISYDHVREHRTKHDVHA